MRLGPPGGVFDETVVRNLFPDVSEGARKQLKHRAVKAGDILRLKPGFFVLSRELRKSDPHPFVLAGMLHSSSHISLESALEFHGLIPEAVYQVSSVTPLRSRTFTTPLGVFSFQRVPAAQPRAGVKTVKLGRDAWAFVATPLRAIADAVYLNGISWKHDGLEFLIKSLRMEEDDLAEIPFDSLDKICDSIKSSRVADFLRRLRKAVTHAE